MISGPSACRGDRPVARFSGDSESQAHAKLNAARIKRGGEPQRLAGSPIRSARDPDGRRQIRIAGGRRSCRQWPYRVVDRTEIEPVEKIERLKYQLQTSHFTTQNESPRQAQIESPKVRSNTGVATHKWRAVAVGAPVAVDIRTGQQVKRASTICSKDRRQ